MGLHEAKKQAGEYRVVWMDRAVLEPVPSHAAEETVKKCLLQASAPGATSPEGCAVLQSTSMTPLFPQQFVSGLTCTG